MLNYNLFNTFVDFVLWTISIATFIAYLRVCYSDPGYVEGSIIMTEEANDDKFHELDTYPDKEQKKQNGKL